VSPEKPAVIAWERAGAVIPAFSYFAYDSRYPHPVQR
jgi:hypothetical protein